MRDLAADGMTMLCATHEMGFAREVASTLSFSTRGRYSSAGRPISCSTRPNTTGPGSSSSG
jgi:polar amino acid transport system ATP-binding protein